MGNVILCRGKSNKTGLILLVPTMENNYLFHNVQYSMNHCFKITCPGFLPFFVFLRDFQWEDESDSYYLGVSNESLNIKD